MRIEIILLLITGAVMANIYTDGKLLRSAFAYKKYYQMAGVAFGAIVLYYVFKKNPQNVHGMVHTANEYMKYLPVDKNTSSMLSPILDFTSKFGGMSGGGSAAILSMGNGLGNNGLGMRNGTQNYAENRIMQSGGVDNTNGSHAISKTKRSVSETKKKYVAAQQGWCCGNCKRQLPAWFEVDHKIRLEHGGSNHIDNLVALCRDCHGEKTAIENL
jgi:hypothetical protein